ncbi:hypothetical protein LDENG_00224120 [Lucifuga dentata]|nr:hypothetical protein LDENG_00224120 [Lucifuga dentata]
MLHLRDGISQVMSSAWCSAHHVWSSAQRVQFLSHQTRESFSSCSKSFKCCSQAFFSGVLPSSHSTIKA